MEKIARICWNTQEWKRPSGSKGKSQVNTSYENKYGFGHEEWLLDFSRVMPDGYHYGFLEALNVPSGKHIGQTYDIHLFTITPNKEKIYVGCLHNAIAIDEDKSRSVFANYKKMGWLKEMKEDVLAVGGQVKHFKAEWMFNVKFKFSEAQINYSNQPIIKSNTLGHRYNLMNKTNDFVFLTNEEGKTQTLDTSSYTRTTQSSVITIDPLHKKIQKGVENELKDMYSPLILEKTDHSSETKRRIDIMGKLNGTDEWHYFEVKTSSAKQAIREALGQILEYSHYDHSSSRASKLYIIGPEKPDKKDIAYIQKLRDMYKLPIWLRWYSFENNKLYEEI